MIRFPLGVAVLASIVSLAAVPINATEALEQDKSSDSKQLESILETALAQCRKVAPIRQAECFDGVQLGYPDVVLAVSMKPDLASLAVVITICENSTTDLYREIDPSWAFGFLSCIEETHQYATGQR
jgi:hypothetical protein